MRELLVRTGRMCCICKSHHSVQVHHIVPKSDGGGDEIDNAIPLCPSCHDRVHNSVGGMTRKYTADELREHRAYTIELIVQAMRPQRNAETTLGDLMAMVADRSISLTRCFVMGLEVAKASGLKWLEEFCNDELTGYRRLNDTQRLKDISDEEAAIVAYRMVDVYFGASHLDVNAFTCGLYDGPAVIRMMQADERFTSIHVIYPEPVSGIEAMAERSNAKGLLTLNITASVFGFAEAGEGKVTGYMRGDTAAIVLTKIRTEFLNRLVKRIANC